MSLLPDSTGFDLQGTLNGLLSTWQQVENIKLQQQITRAMVRDGDLFTAAQYQDAQAKAASYASDPTAPRSMLISPTLLLIGGGVLLFVLLKD